MKKCNGWLKKKTTLEPRIRLKKKIGKNLMKLSIHWRNYSEYNTWGKSREWEREKVAMKHKMKRTSINLHALQKEKKKKNGESHCSQKDKEEKERERKGTNEKILNI